MLSGFASAKVTYYYDGKRFLPHEPDIRIIVEIDLDSVLPKGLLDKDVTNLNGFKLEMCGRSGCDPKPIAEAIVRVSTNQRSEIITWSISGRIPMYSERMGTIKMDDLPVKDYLSKTGKDTVVLTDAPGSWSYVRQP
ncbi:MAG: hypothetical protein ACJAVV_001673 [Alphaproteobacteria bacterium]|jgi:hypothetical protein